MAWRSCFAAHGSECTERFYSERVRDELEKRERAWPASDAMHV